MKEQELQTYSNRQNRSLLLNKSESPSIYSQYRDSDKISQISSRYSQPHQSLMDAEANKKLPSEKLIKIAILDAVGDKSHPVTKNKNLYDLIAEYTSQFPAIAPENIYLIAWHGIIQFIIIYEVIEVGLLLGYGHPVWDDILEYLIPLNITLIVCLFADCVVSLFKAYYEKGLLVKNHRLIAKRYIPIYLVLDIVAIISITIPFATQSYALNWLKLLFLPKLITAYKIDKQYFRITQLSIRLHTFYLLSRLILLLILGSHYLGIFFYMIDYYVYETNYYGPNTPNLCWIYNAQAFSQMVILLPWYGQYEYTMYFSIGTMTTIAYGDITPLNPLQTLYIAFALLAYTVGFAYILSQILRILMQAQASKFEHTNTLLIVTNMMRDKMITQKLQIQVRKFYEKMWKQEVYRNRVIEKELIDRLPQRIRNQLFTQLYEEMFVTMGLWNPSLVSLMPGKKGDNAMDYKIQSQFMALIANSVVEQRLVEGHHLYYEGEQFNIDTESSHSCFYIKPLYKNKIAEEEKFNILNQIVEISIANNSIRTGNNSQSREKMPQKICGIKKGCIGIESFYTGQPRNHSAKVSMSSLVYRLPRKYFLQSLPFATSFERENIALMTQKVNIMYCFLCQMNNDHSFLKCPFATYQPNRYEVIVRSIHSEILTALVYKLSSDPEMKVGSYDIRKQRMQEGFENQLTTPPVPIKPDIKEVIIERKHYRFDALKNVDFLKNNRYRIRNKYQMLISNPYYSKLIKKPSIANNRASIKQVTSNLTQSVFLEDAEEKVEYPKVEKQKEEQLEIRQIDSVEEHNSSEEEQDNFQGMKRRSSGYGSDILDDIDENKDRQFLEASEQKKMQSFSQRYKKEQIGIFESSSSSFSSSQSSKDLQNYMKETQIFIRHLQKEQEHERIKQQLKRSTLGRIASHKYSSMVGSPVRGLNQVKNCRIQNNFSLMSSKVIPSSHEKMKKINEVDIEEFQLNLENSDNPLKQSYSPSRHEKEQRQINEDRKQELQQLQREHQQQLEKLEQLIEYYRNSENDLSNITDRAYQYIVYHPQANSEHVIQQYNTLYGFNIKRRKMQNIDLLLDEMKKGQQS